MMARLGVGSWIGGWELAFLSSALAAMGRAAVTGPHSKNLAIVSEQTLILFPRRCIV